jgi:hypothetical protein
MLVNAWLNRTILALVGVCLAACTVSFVMRPEGRLGDVITFHFQKSLTDAEPTQLRVVKFLVEEQVSSAQWSAVWELQGSQSLSELAYGVRYPGLKETAEAKPFSREVRYRAIAIIQPRVGATGYSAVYFSFDESGLVVAER